MKNINISISFDGNEPIVNSVTTNVPSGSKAPEAGVFTATSEILTYKLLDMGYLKYLLSVGTDEKTKRKTYTFEDNDETKEVYEKFFADIKADRQKRYQERTAKKKEDSKNDESELV
jgi:hypothetical protein